MTQQYLSTKLQKEEKQTEAENKENSPNEEKTAEKTAEKVVKNDSPDKDQKVAEQGSAAVSNLRVLENIEVKYHLYLNYV